MLLLIISSEKTFKNVQLVEKLNVPCQLLFLTLKSYMIILVLENILELY